MSAEIFFYEDEVAQISEERIVKNKKFKKEIAYHEASHFVIQCLGLKYIDDFNNIEYLIICIEKLGFTGKNEVHGFGPKVPLNEQIPNRPNEEPESLIKFYNSNRIGLVAKLFSLVAGYASYPLFLKDSLYFICDTSKYNSAKQENELLYYSKEVALQTNTFDFISLKIKLSTYYSLTGEKAREATIKLIETVQQIMKIWTVKLSIKLVMKILILSECKKIKGIKLKLLILFVQLITCNVSFKKRLELFVLNI